MTKTVTCPDCGCVFDTKKEEFTTLRVSKDFLSRLKEEQINSTHEATLRRLLGWKEDKK